MRAVVVDEYADGPEAFTVSDDVADPVVGPDTVLVRMRAASINPVDYKIATGALAGGFPSYLPMVPGWDAAGTVEAVGPAVTTVEVGEPVVSYARKDYLQHGTWGELAAVPQRGVVGVTSDIDLVAASCLPLAGLTARQCLDAVHVGEGDTVLVHSASGGVGHLLVQLAVARGARVLGTVGAANADFVASLGAEPIDHQGDVVGVARSLAPGGVDAVVDLHSADVLTASLPLLSDPHRFVTVTAADVAQERGGHYVFVQPDAEQLTQLVRSFDAGELVPTVSATYPMADVRAAVQRSKDGVRGKVVLTFG